MKTRFLMHLPDDWTPEQALSVYELLHELAEAIWERYETPLINLLTAKPEQRAPSQPNLLDVDDDLPF
jgi:hypothetical protein